jgi:hemolysin III
VAWFVAGGVSYSADVAFFLLDSQTKFSHSIWDLFVMAGSACHFATIAWYL